MFGVMFGKTDDVRSETLNYAEAPIELEVGLAGDGNLVTKSGSGWPFWLLTLMKALLRMEERTQSVENLI